MRRSTKNSHGNIIRFSFPFSHSFSFIVVVLVSLFLFLPVAGFALDVPALTGRVVDNAGILDPAEESEISAYLQAVEDSSGAQIAVLTIESLEGESLEMFSYQTATEWKLGQEDQDNGALLLVSVADRQLRIEVGYGLEGVLTDATSGYIIRNVITPSFRNGDYGGGILAGVKAMGGLISGEIPVTQYQQKETSRSRPYPMGGSVIAIIIFLIIFVLRGILFFRRPGLFFLLGMGGGHHRHTGGFGGGGFSGGGFSGGGGSFGGGGASGGW